jgi:DnaJ domain
MAPRKRRRNPRPADPFTKAVNQFIDTIDDHLDEALSRLLTGLMHQVPPEAFTPIVPPTGYPTRKSKPSPATSPTHSPTPTLYDVLEVSPHASKETIDAAFRALSKRYHPDNLGTGDASRMRKLIEAHEILKDERKRVAYNKQIGLRQ